jgi:hypothetical protein
MDQRDLKFQEKMYPYDDKVQTWDIARTIILERKFTFGLFLPTLAKTFELFSAMPFFQ